MTRSLANPLYLLLGLSAGLIIWLFIWRMQHKVNRVIFPALDILKGLSRGRSKDWLRYMPLALKSAAIVLIAIALARPQSISSGQDVWSEGIDIVIVLDISGSMLAQDFHPDRAQVAKLVAADFIQGRKNDRIGIVLFAKYAFTQCPLTIDHDILIELLRDTKVGMVDENNTAIGSAIAAALKRLETSTGKSKVIILLTDGENNFGLPPMTATEAAQALGARIYTIGVGTRGLAPYPARDIFGRVVMQQVQVSIDENLLREIARATGGRYFRATDEQKLREIFAEIDKMEKQRIEVKAYRRYAELFYPWAASALVLLAIAFLIETTLMRRLA